MKVARKERLTHFIFSKSNFSVVNQRVKYGTFIPQKSSPKEISVYRTSSLTEIQVWAIGEKYVKRGDRTIKARADLSAGAVYDIGLEVVQAPQPHELHANIIPVPVEKEDRNEVLEKLAGISTLVLVPPEV